LQQFDVLYHQIVAGNHRFNLTRITEPREFLEKHLWDSLYGIRPWLTRATKMLQFLSPFNQNTNPDLETTTSPFAAQLKVIDIGTGAGFPGVPVAMVQPQWSLTLLDSTRKKIAFLDTLKQILSLTYVIPCCDRAEILGQRASHRQTFDLALIRAVSSATVCAEYALPFLKLNGLAILYRGQWTQIEHQALTVALKQLGGEIAAVSATQTPKTAAQRHCIYLRKLTPTPPEFPRRAGLPAQQPL
jgi:16S rRNA (guanine527-N7)-methyltransferase